jgi:hypothetical protein
MIRNGMSNLVALATAASPLSDSSICKYLAANDGVSSTSGEHFKVSQYVVLKHLWRLTRRSFAQLASRTNDNDAWVGLQLKLHKLLLQLVPPSRLVREKIEPCISGANVRCPLPTSPPRPRYQCGLFSEAQLSRCLQAHGRMQGTAGEVDRLSGPTCHMS